MEHVPAKVFALKMEGSLIDDVEDDSISTAAQFMYISRLPTLSKIKKECQSMYCLCLSCFFEIAYLLNHFLRQDMSTSANRSSAKGGLEILYLLSTPGGRSFLQVRWQESV